ncbi:thioesterase II family protein [Streptomyces adonidis]|uniref:thioesterase II family protein n=1 Tax=Streptomyces adonidis TaxID=3231367 RepID=UPI0034DAEC22
MFIRSVSAKPDATLHVIGFPGAGGSQSHFVPWDALLGPHVRLSIVDPWQLYFAQQEHHLERMTDAAALLIPELSALDSPAVLVGHSRGSLLAYETAQRLTATGRGDMVAALVALAHRAPPSPPPQLISGSSTELLGQFLREMGGTPPEVFADRELLETVLDRLRGELAMSEAYRHTWPTPLPCPLGVYTGRSDISVPAAESGLWQRAVTGPCSVRTFPGDHFFPFGEGAGPVVTALTADFVLAGDTHGI